jgi:23S rRNA (pseudouridine1915-N3)-methyltransferase
MVQGRKIVAMKTALWMVGKTSYPFIEEGMELYIKRLHHYLSFETQIFPHPKGNLSPEQTKSWEAEAILRKLQPGDFLVLLDERGKAPTSPAFAAQMERWQSAGHKRLVFLIGGAYGFDASVYDRANERLSLSNMTVSHQIVRLFFLEQLYRAMTILRNEPYHHA